MNVDDEFLDAKALTQRRAHCERGLGCISLARVGGPGNVGDGGALIGDAGLHVADYGAGGSDPHDPVQPELRLVRRGSTLPLGDPRFQFIARQGCASREVVETRIIEHAEEIICVSQDHRCETESRGGDGQLDVGGWTIGGHSAMRSHP